MSDIKLVSEEYTSKFVTGPELTQKMANKQDTLQWYHESETSPWKVDMAANEVTLRGGNDTAGIIHEKTMIKIDDSGVDIKAKVGGGPWRNILSSGLDDNVFLGDPDTGIYCHGPLYDKDDIEIKGGPKWIKENTSETYGWITIGESQDGAPADITLGKNGALRSIFVSGPLCSQHSEPLRLHGYDELDIRLEDYTLTLNSGNLKKLKDLIDNADLLLALLHN